MLEFSSDTGRSHRWYEICIENGELVAITESDESIGRMYCRDDTDGISEDVFRKAIRAIANSDVSAVKDFIRSIKGDCEFWSIAKDEVSKLATSLVEALG